MALRKRLLIFFLSSPVCCKSDCHLHARFNTFLTSLSDLEACMYDNISWHLIGMSSKPEIFSVHINGQVMEQRHHRISTVNLVGGASTTVNMTVSEEGRWLISSLVQKHLKGKETSIY